MVYFSYLFPSYIIVIYINFLTLIFQIIFVILYIQKMSEINYNQTLSHKSTPDVIFHHHSQSPHTIQTNSNQSTIKQLLLSIIYKVRQIRAHLIYHRIYFILTIIYSLSILIVTPNPQNSVASIIQQVVQFMFLGTVILRLISLDSIHSGWCVCQFISIVTGTACLFVKDPDALRYLKAIRCIRLFLFVRITGLYQIFKNFIRGFRNVSRIIIPSLTLIYLYTIIGLFAFQGNVYYRCRHPENLNRTEDWTYEPDLNFLCGNRQCPIKDGIQLLCLNPYDYNVKPNPDELNTLMMGYGLLSYNNIAYSFFNTLKLIFMTGWSRSVVLIKQNFIEEFTIIYFFSFLFVGCYIYMNVFYGILMSNEQENSEEQNQQISLVERNNQANEEIDQADLNGSQSRKIIPEWMMRNILLGFKIPKQPLGDHKKRENLIVEEIDDREFHITGQSSKEQQDMSAHLVKIHLLKKDYYLPSDPGMKKKLLFIRKLYLCLNNIMIVLSCVTLSMRVWEDDERMLIIKGWLDLFFTLQFTLHIFGHMILYIIKDKQLEEWSQKYKVNLDKNYNLVPATLIFQLVIFIISMAGLMREFDISEGFSDILNPKLKSCQVVRLVKYLRILVVLKDQNISRQINICFSRSINCFRKIKEYLLFYLLMIILFSLIGFNLFHSKNQIQEISFNSVYESFYFTFMTFYNEQWDIFMFMHYPTQGLILVIYQIIVVIIGSLILSKYFMALIMNNFCHELEAKESQKELEDCSNQITPEILQFSKDGSLLTKLEKVDAEEAQAKSELPKTTIDNIQELKQGQGDQQDEETENQQNIAFIIKKLRIFMTSKVYVAIYLTLVMFDIVDIAHRNPTTDRNQHRYQVWAKLQIFLFGIFILDTVLWMVLFGLVRDRRSYFKILKFNYFDVIFVVFFGISFALPIYETILILRKLKALRLFKWIELFSLHHKKMRSCIISYSKIIPTLISFLIVILFIYGFFANIITIVYGGWLRSCVNYPSSLKIETKWDCLNWGGDWIVSPLNADNFLNSVIYIFMIASTEGWSNLMFEMANLKGLNYQPESHANQFSRIFFILFFFIGNMIILNIFIGLCIYTIKKLQNKETGREKLEKHEDEWLMTKILINQLKLTKRIVFEPGTLSYYCHRLLISVSYSVFRYIVIIAYIAILSVKTDENQFLKRSNIIKITVVFITLSFINFSLEILGRERKFNRSQLLFHIMFLIYSVVFCIMHFGFFEQIDQQIGIVLQSILICFLLFRYWLYLYQIEYVKKTMHLLSLIIPKTIPNLIFLIAILVLYSIIGMELFAYLRPNTELNEFDQNYTTYFKSMFALIKFSTWESPIDQITNAAQELSPNFVCYEITTYQEFLQYGFYGCGSKFKSYIFFITFHIFYSMILLTSLTANIYDSYCEAKKQQIVFKKQIQLTRFKEQWELMDLQATGYLRYHDFWRFISRIHLIYKISEESVISIESKQKFMKNFDLPVHLADGELCFEFYEVMEKLATMIIGNKYKKRLSVTKACNVFQNLSEIEKKQNSLPTTTQFRSSQIFSIILLKQGLRLWKRRAIGKPSATILSCLNITKHNDKKKTYQEK